MNEKTLELLAAKKAAMEAELADLRHCADQAKTWGRIVEQRAVNVLNHIRDLKEFCEQTLVEVSRLE